MKKLFFMICFYPVITFSQKLPYFSGMTFRNSCPFILDQYNKSFDPHAVKKGSVIFVKPEQLELFCARYVPRIKERFVLITHNNDWSMPGKHKKLLNNPKLIAWFAKNATIKHPKLIGIPIGMVGEHMFARWISGSYQDLDDIIERVKHKAVVKNKLLCAHFSIAKDRGKERAMVWDLFKNKEYCYKNNTKKTYKDYLQNLAESKFVLSPRGSGWDCYRTWEALIVGSYPIVRRSPIDALYKGLPVVIVNNWTDITPEFLEKKYAEFSAQHWNLEKLYAPYWFDLIQQASARA